MPYWDQCLSPIVNVVCKYLRQCPGTNFSIATLPICCNIEYGEGVWFLQSGRLQNFHKFFMELTWSQEFMWDIAGSFQNKLVSSSFKWVPKYSLLLAKRKGEERSFWDGKAETYPMNHLTCGDNVSYYKSVHHPVPTSENRKHSGNFKSVSPAFNWVSGYILFLVKLKGERREATL